MSLEPTNFEGGLEINSLIQYGVAKVKVTSAQLLALNATPQTIVEAPGEGKFLELVSATVHKPAGTAYAGIAAGEDLAIKYTNGSGTQVNTSLETTGFLDQTTAETRVTHASTTAAIEPVENAALVLQLLTGEITTGTSDLYVTVYYRVVRDFDVEPL